MASIHKHFNLEPSETVVCLPPLLTLRLTLFHVDQLGFKGQLSPVPFKECGIFWLHPHQRNNHVFLLFHRFFIILWHPEHNCFVCPDIWKRSLWKRREVKQKARKWFWWFFLSLVCVQVIWTSETIFCEELIFAPKVTCPILQGGDCFSSGNSRTLKTLVIPCSRKRNNNQKTGGGEKMQEWRRNDASCGHIEKLYQRENKHF